MYRTDEILVYNKLDTNLSLFLIPNIFYSLSDQNKKFQGKKKGKEKRRSKEINTVK